MTAIEKSDLVAILCRGFQTTTRFLFQSSEPTSPTYPGYSNTLEPPLVLSAFPTSSTTSTPSVAGITAAGVTLRLDPVQLGLVGGSSTSGGGSLGSSPLKSSKSRVEIVEGDGSPLTTSRRGLLWGDARRDKGDNPRRRSFDENEEALEGVPFAREPVIPLVVFLDRMRRSVVRRFSAKVVDPFTKAPVVSSELESLIRSSGLFGAHLLPSPSQTVEVDFHDIFKRWFIPVDKFGAVMKVPGVVQPSR